MRSVLTLKLKHWFPKSSATQANSCFHANTKMVPPFRWLIPVPTSPTSSFPPLLVVHPQLPLLPHFGPLVSLCGSTIAITLPLTRPTSRKLQLHSPLDSRPPPIVSPPIPHPQSVSPHCLPSHFSFGLESEYCLSLPCSLRTISPSAVPSAGGTKGGRSFFLGSTSDPSSVRPTFR